MHTRPSAESSYPLSDARHPPALAKPLDYPGAHFDHGAGSPAFPSAGSDFHVAPIVHSARAAPPCLSRSAHQMHNSLSFAAHPPFSLPRSQPTACSSAPATPRRALVGLDRHRHRHHRQPPHLQLHSVRSVPAMSASLPSVASLPSLSPFVHSKLGALPALDMEHDRLARACGQGPVFALGCDIPSSSRSQEAQISSESRPSAKLAVSSEARHAVPPAPLNLEEPVFSSPSSLAWSLRPRATSVRVSQRHHASSSHQPFRPRSTSQPASIPVFTPSSPRAVLRSLRDVLDLEGLQIEECLDVQAVFERWEAAVCGLASGEAVRHLYHHKTFGAPVAAAVRCASMSTVLGGYQHDVPWVVYACVEELNRTGIYQTGLFRAVPNRTRLARLVEAFDLPLPTHSSDQGELCPRMTNPTLSTTRASLRKESMPDICALLKTYLDLLPEPLLDANLTSALHRLCVQPCLARENEMDESAPDSDGYFARARSAPPSWASARMPADVIPMTPSEQRHAQLSLEGPQILLAQHVLRLAPPASLALLAYLLAFFTQLPLCPDNGMDFADVARMFGRVLVGGAAADLGMVKECVGWLLDRWARVSDGLFDVVPPELAEEQAQARSEPGSATREAFASPVCARPLGAGDPGAPRQAAGEGEAEGVVRMQAPYDPGLELSLGLRAGGGAARAHSTSVSSDGSSSAADTDDDAIFDPRYSMGAPPGRTLKDEEMREAGAYAYAATEPETEAAYDPFDRGPLLRVQPEFALADRQYVSCPASPRRRFAASATPAARSPLSLPSSFGSDTDNGSNTDIDADADADGGDAESSGASWPSSSACSTSRCSPAPFELTPRPACTHGHARGQSAEPEFAGHGYGASHDKAANARERAETSRHGASTHPGSSSV